MKKFVTFLAGTAIVMALLLGVLLIAIAGMLMFAPDMLIKIIKTVIIAACFIGGLWLLITAIIAGVKYIGLKFKESKNQSE